MKRFLYTPPPPFIKFYPCKAGVFAARGAVVVASKSENKLPQLEHFRFEFFIGCEHGKIEQAHFAIDELCSLADLENKGKPSWKDEREEADLMLQDHLNYDGMMSVAEYDSAINLWVMCANDSYSEIENEKHLKQCFSMTTEDIYVVRHYFETDWIILDNQEMKIDFRDVYKH